MARNDTPLRFANQTKLRKQMRKRGWTERMIRQALRTRPRAVRGGNGPALRYIHPTTGKSVVVDATTGEIFHLGDEGFRYG